MKISRDMWIKRQELEARFPTLAFHYFYDYAGDVATVRVMPADPADNGLLSSKRGKLGGQMYEETIDPADFPTEGFIARCCLIAPPKQM